MKSGRKVAPQAAKAVAISIGCPAGVGAEVTMGALAELGREGSAIIGVVVGDERLVYAAAERAKLSADRLVRVASRDDVAGLARGAIGWYAASTKLGSRVRPGKPSKAGGAAQLAWIDEALALVVSGACGALVTAPVSKASIATSGARGASRFRGHTEHLASRLGVPHVVMAFANARMATALVTTHLPLRKVPRAITPRGVTRACLELEALLVRLGHDKPRIAVAGLNPHAGEGGLLGDEESRLIAPGMAEACELRASEGRTIRLAGPVGAESAFRLAASGIYQGVVAMYHDQATIACKLMGFGELVNVTLGLPIVRTSVDHGTAYDLAGTGKASCDGMRAALTLGARLAHANPGAH